MSREAPVLILKYDTTEMVAGGAGNAANNVAALGGPARWPALVGADDEGRRLLASFHRGVDRTHVMRSRQVPDACQDAHPGRRHSFRQAADRPHRSRGRAGRSTRAVSRAIRGKDRAALWTTATRCSLSDYGSGLVTPALADVIRRDVSKRARRRARFRCCVDSRYRLLDYRDLTACTPNESEVEQALGIRIDDDRERSSRRAGRLLRRTGMKAVLITRGSRGMALFRAEAADHSHRRSSDPTKSPT